MDQEEIKRQKQLQIQQQEEQKKRMINGILDRKARERLSNLRLANPDLAEKAESLIMYLYQEGQIGSINEEQLKAILAKLTEKRQTKIIRR